MKRPHILVLTERWYPDTVGGSERVATWQVDGLIERGYDVTVFCALNEGGLKADERVSEHLRVVRAGRAGSFPGSTMFSILRSSVGPLRALMQESTFDVVLAHHPLITSVWFSITTEQRPPVVYIFHSSRPQEIRFEGPRRSYPGNRLWTEWVAASATRHEQRALAGARTICYLSAFSHSILESEYVEFRERFTQLAPGIPTADFPVPVERDFTSNEFFTVRRLTPRMGLDVLIDAAALLRDRGLTFTVHIAGSGHLEKALRSHIRALQLEDHVQLLGRISDDELHTWYAEASCFVLPTTGLEELGNRSKKCCNKVANGE